MAILHPTRAAFALLLAAGLMALVVLAQTPDRSIFWSAVVDAGHAPLFGLFALTILWAASAWGGATGSQAAARPGSLRIRTYVLALAVTVTFGALTEILQALGSKDAELWDFIRDVLGGASALLLAFALGQRKRPRRAGGRLGRVLPVLVAAVLLAVALLRVTTVAIAHLWRDSAFPRLCEFNHRWGATFIGVQDAVITQGEPIGGWAREAPGPIARVTFHPAAYPGLSIREPYPDWTGYDRLTFDVYSEAPAPVQLHLRIDDVHSEELYTDRFNRVLIVEPGANRISIALDDVRRGPRARPMDLAHIRALTLFAMSPPAPFSVYLDGFRLER